MKNIKSHDLEAPPIWAGRGGAGVTSNPSSDVVCLLFSVGVTSVAYRHDVKRENFRFWLFQNYVKSNVMSNNTKMSNDMCN